MFLAIGEGGNLFSMLTIVGPLVIGTLDMPPLGIPQTAHGGWDGGSPLQFRLNAIFTMPEARRKSISKVLIDTPIEFLDLLGMKDRQFCSFFLIFSPLHMRSGRLTRVYCIACESRAHCIRDLQC